MKYRKIALVGMMGSGKSSVAKALFDITKIKCFEADDIFEKENNIEIKEIFEKFSEFEFRKKETEILKRIVQNDEFILSAGGGAPISKINQDLLYNPKIFSIYLKTSADEIYNRLKNDTKRPLLNCDNLKERIIEIMNSREKFYLMASITIQTDNKTPEKIAEEITEKL